MDRLPTLHDKYTSAGEMLGGYGDAPPYVTNNLAYALRPYQNEAIGRYLFYIDRDQQNKQLPVQLLFNMATGSGKTLVMAALMLDLYKRGYRNFIFFVNSSTIIDKTRANFLDSAAQKYQFAQKLVIDGKPIQIQEVSNFSESKDDSINIVFTTIQGLHTDLNNPRENRLTYEELKSYSVVLLSDEAHHLNASTKRSAKDEKDNTTWEQTINNIMALSSSNVLLEFTATIDMSDANIWQKYNQRLLYQYDLKAFRQDGFSKDVLIYEVDSDLMDRALQAIIISQYRKKVAFGAGIWCKPVVMFKSATKAASKEFYEQFADKLQSLTAEDITRQQPKASGILLQAFAYFHDSGIPLEDIAAELKNDFSLERSILIDSDNKVAEDQLLLNTLEAKNNEIRAVFSVDMLDEGWDVLNLFDIVRLYDKRDSKNGRPGKTTLREAQLIGRGARYFPFSIDGEDQFKRKFDKNELEPLRAIEQLHYHSAHNPKYIQEISQALKDSGIMPDEMVERTLHLKDDFINSRTYTHGVVWKNKQISRIDARKAKQIRLLSDEYDIPTEVSVDLPSHIGQEISIFGAPNTTDIVTDEKVTKRVKLSSFPKSLVRTAVYNNKKFSFSAVEKAFFGVQSMNDFMFGKSLLGGIEVVVSGDSTSISSMSAEQKLFIVEAVLRVIEEKIDQSEYDFVGSEEFEALPIKELFKRTIKRKYAISESQDKETGYPQYQSARYALNLADREWHAYDENYGTSEEKSLVVTLDGLIEELQKKWSDIYLLRNEKAVQLYSFDDGKVFEPDYLLFANDKRQGNVSWQLFIEPKGNQFLDRGSESFDDGKEGWKQQFLEQIADRFEATTLAEDKNYRVVGLPFYNEEHTSAQFAAKLKELV